MMKLERFNTKRPLCVETDFPKTATLEPMKWRATQIDDATWYVDTDDKAETVRSSHCKCCALVQVITEHGGTVDLRGLHRYGICYQWLVVTMRQRSELSGEGSPTTEGL